MPATNKMYIYVLNVGQADTNEIRSTGSQSPTAYGYCDTRTDMSPLDNPNPTRLRNATQLPNWDDLLRTKLGPHS
jgi:hypothetical protein